MLIWLSIVVWITIIIITIVLGIERYLENRLIIHLKMDIQNHSLHRRSLHSRLYYNMTYYSSFSLVTYVRKGRVVMLMPIAI